MLDPLLLFAVTVAFAIWGVGYTCRMAVLERRGKLAHRGALRRKR